MRKDGAQLTKIDPLRKMMLHVFGGRNNSVVYSREEIKFDNATEYLRTVNKGRDNKITTFHLVNAALIRTVAKYPELNRFVASKKLYARNHYSVSFVALKKINGENVETHAKINFNLDETIFEVATKIDEAIRICRDNEDKDDDKLMEFLSKFPSPFLTIFAAIFKKISEKGLLPLKLSNTIPLFTSVFISNLGSIGHDALFHHLYELGTCSVFATLGKKIKKEDGTYLTLHFSIDERVADGIVLVKALRYFNSIMEAPQKLENRPEVIIKDKDI